MKKALINLMTQKDFLFFILLAVYLCLLLVPYVKSWPNAGQLDPSWSLAINEAIIRNLRFGYDIIFTYGPAMNLVYPMYNPANEIVVIGVGLFRALLFLTNLLVIWSYKKNESYLLFFVFLLACSFQVLDRVNYVFPLLTGLAIYLLFSVERSSFKPKTVLLYSLLLAGLALPTIIKGSYAAYALGVYILSAIYLIYNKYYIVALWSIIAMLIWISFFWVLFGQQLIDLPYYFKGMSSMASGFAGAMGTPPWPNKYYDIVLFWLVLILLVYQIACGKGATSDNFGSKAYLILLYSGFFFIISKNAFVRHDGGHVMVIEAIPPALVLLPLIVTRERLGRILAACLIITFTILGMQQRVNFPAHFSKPFLPLANGPYALDQYLRKSSDELLTMYQNAKKKLSKTEPLPTLPGNSDLYSYETAWLLVSQNQWNPRPIFQSYGAYTPWLLEKNRDHLLGNNAPDNIFFKLQDIDYRWPTQDDGASFPVILSLYELSEVTGNFLILTKKPDAGTYEFPNPGQTHQAVFGEKIALPDTDKAIFAHINIKPSLLGRLLNFIYKPVEEIRIEAELADGNTIITKRLIPASTETGILLSPYIEDNNALHKLFLQRQDPNLNLLADNRVKAITISKVGINRTFDKFSSPLSWKNDYEISFAEF